MSALHFYPPFQFAKIIQDMQDFVLHGHSFALTVSSFRAAVKSHVDCAKDVSKIRAIFIFDIIRITKNGNIFFFTRYRNCNFWPILMNGWKRLPFLQTVFMNSLICTHIKTLSGKGILFRDNILHSTINMLCRKLK